MLSTQIAKNLEYINPGPMDSLRGPYSTLAAACDKIKNVWVKVDGVDRNLREGKEVLIGSVLNSIPHAWQGGFANGDLKPIAASSVVKDGGAPVSQGAVYETIFGGTFIFGEGKTLNSYSVNPSATNTATYVINNRYANRSIINRLRCNCVVAGKVLFRSYSADGNVLTPFRNVTIDLVVGINDVVTSLEVPKGGMTSMTITGENYLGRIGWLSTAPEADYYPVGGNTGSAAFTLPNKATVGGFGVTIYSSAIDSVQSQINAQASSMSGIYKAFGKKITNEWVPEFGGLVPDYTTNPGYTTLNFTSANQSIKIGNALPANEIKAVAFKAKQSAGGSPMFVTVGLFASVPSPPKTFRILVTETEQTFSLDIEGSNGNISIGIIAADNGVRQMMFRDFTVYSASDLDSAAEKISTVKAPQSFNLGTVFSSIQVFDKPLTKIGVIGDSLMANDTGGAIPNVESSVSERPIRLGQSNSISRRLYDYLSVNKPQFRRLDNAAWVKTGTWTKLNSTGFFEPIYANETYHSSQAGATASITVPAGKENFAFICRIGTASGSIEAYLNGVLYKTIDTLKANAGHTGNPYKTVEILGLPSGQANTIEIRAKASNTNSIYLWGGFYWSGNTLMVYNTGHGGHNLQQLIDNHLDDEVVDNNFDAILFEHTLMNDTARMADSGTTLSQSIAALKTILDNKIKGKDLLMMSCQPYGIDPQVTSRNYYAQYPGMEGVKDSLKQVVFDYKLPYIDVFDVFKKKVQNRGGTLAGGESGLWYTWDGQHQSEFGMEVFWNIIKPVFSRIRP